MQNKKYITLTPKYHYHIGLKKIVFVCDYVYMHVHAMQGVVER